MAHPYSGVMIAAGYCRTWSGISVSLLTLFNNLVKNLLIFCQLFQCSVILLQQLLSQLMERYLMLRVYSPLFTQGILYIIGGVAVIMSIIFAAKRIKRLQFEEVNYEMGRR